MTVLSAVNVWIARSAVSASIVLSAASASGLLIDSVTTWLGIRGPSSLRCSRGDLAGDSADVGNNF